MLGIHDIVNADAAPAVPVSKLFECDPANGNPLYEGTAYSAQNPQAAEAVWAIKAYTYDAAGFIATIRWANGSTAYNQIWNNRAALTYK